ncbi:hypothetical protein CHS0354_029465 [Potamilus streckersoni]|uniref:Phospholipase B1, membrane-associated n=1 Tax=Potamilus streckersoni TaxID=2493646 RepID=A0AAE0W0U6_9BIVA|nr:hypothetical protein CHS0354_029465 [Potamilus streckersoni]
MSSKSAFVWVLVTSTWTILLKFSGADYAAYRKYIQEQATNETFVKLFQEHLKLFQPSNGKALGFSDTFDCKQFPHPARSATSVHSLTPYDVKVVGAMGDSITAGTGITAVTVLGLLREDRGLSWSIGGIGGIDDHETVPNALKFYNPSLAGFSTGSGSASSKYAHLNVAVAGETSSDISRQAQELINRMKKEPGVDFENDWKVITVFIGGNDLCDYCKDKETYSAENYVSNIQKGLDILHAQVPRAFVNLVEVLNIAVVRQLNQNLLCDGLHLFLCGCAAYPLSKEAEEELAAEVIRYREETEKLIATGRYDTRDDFTVVLQPFLKDTSVPMKDGCPDDYSCPDLSYFAPDCFHFSEKGHQAAAGALWNNMVEPVSKKRTSWTPGELVECPSATSPYFATNKNNKSTDNQLGGVYSADQKESNSKPSGTDGSGEISTIGIAVAVISGACLCIVAALFARRFYIKKRRSEEKVLLLQSNKLSVYPCI